MIFNKEMEIMMTHLRRLHISGIFIFILGLSWYLLHLLVSIMHTGSHLIQVMKCYIISSEFLQKYRMLPLHKLQYLAVVIDSAEAKNATQVKQLLHWLSDIGVKYIMLYDMEGVLKQSLETYLISLANSSCNAKPCTDTSLKNVITRVRLEKTTIELLSSSDCKPGAAKAANFLLSNYLKGDTEGCNKAEPTFTEADMSAALKSVGFDGPDPDLLLVYGPARCHLGFPAWRMRYTEIVHMGHLKSMKRGAIIKAIYDFSNKHQNYGT
ncbi:dehydrodolichyl diphosphate synthase complex subunit Nus1-like isoform X2 [Asparagus officinalis]|nr:dehydrodolichyl diphosphate synthase complex subunit Nus1-like isoform X2 [Asparagus officinalis]